MASPIDLSVLSKYIDIPKDAPYLLSGPGQEVRITLNIVYDGKLIVNCVIEK